VRSISTVLLRKTLDFEFSGDSFFGQVSVIPKPINPRSIFHIRLEEKNR
jgi:hypothetical protein